jgi:hypothetical protein
MYASLMCRKVAVLCSSTFMSMHDSCEHTRSHTFSDHSHTLDFPGFPRLSECVCDEAADRVACTSERVCISFVRLWKCSL